MKITLNEKNRKPLVEFLGTYMSTKPVYLKTPTYAFQIGKLTVTRAGDIEGPDDISKEELDDLLEAIKGAGYIPEGIDHLMDEEPKEATQAQEIADSGLTTSLPLDKVAVGNLTNLLEAKGSLIKKALGIDDIRIEVEEDKVNFPWFPSTPEADEIHAYTALISALCKMSKEQKRINATEKNVENERYAFRCFLLRLGFIGNDYKQDRKILLKNLSGNSAFKGGASNENS